jgi:hypothetical protein
MFAVPSLFARAPRIHKRIVSWGENAQPVELPHRGVVVSEQELLGDLWERAMIATPASAPAPKVEAEWTIASANNSTSPPTARGFGSRRASTTRVELAERVAEDCCWVESLADGWLFLLPSGDRHAILISTGYFPNELITQSRMIAPLIASFDAGTEPAHYFPAFPQILPELCRPHWLACGSVAMSFDPLCGEGAGHAVREALLAAAVIRGATRGYTVETLLAHYTNRLMQGFSRHLQVCLPFYQRGGKGSFWQAEAAALTSGIEWMHTQLQNQTPPHYRLVGYELQPIAG